jgi:hypothetical protein
MTREHYKVSGTNSGQPEDNAAQAEQKQSNPESNPWVWYVIMITIMVSICTWFAWKQTRRDLLPNQHAFAENALTVLIVALGFCVIGLGHVLLRPSRPNELRKRRYDIPQYQPEEIHGRSRPRRCRARTHTSQKEPSADR